MCRLEQDAAWEVKLDALCEPSCSSLLSAFERDECSCQDFSQGSKQTKGDILFCEKARTDFREGRWSCDSRWHFTPGRPTSTSSGSGSGEVNNAPLCAVVKNPFPSCVIESSEKWSAMTKEEMKQHLCQRVVAKTCYEHISSIFGECACSSRLSGKFKEKCELYTKVSTNYSLQSLDCPPAPEEA